MSLNRYLSRHAPARAARLVAAVLLALSAVVHAADISPAENARIEYLMASVASLAGAQFIRNGSTYGAQAAVEHLRLKLRLAGSHVKTAEDFIRYCASASSISGTPYQIRFADGSLVPSAAFFTQKLKEYDRQRAPGRLTSPASPAPHGIPKVSAPPQSAMSPTLANGKICYLELPASDPGRSADFYAKVFGWRMRKRGDGATAFEDTTDEVSGAFVTGRAAGAAAGLLV